MGNLQKDYTNINISSCINSTKLHKLSLEIQTCTQLIKALTMTHSVQTKDMALSELTSASHSNTQK